jgi:hypothetical protein
MTLSLGGTLGEQNEGCGKCITASGHDIRYQSRMVSGLATRAISFRALRPSRFAISAKWTAPHPTVGAGSVDGL